MPRRRSLILAEQGRLRVLADPDRPGGRLLEQDGAHACYVDLDDPVHLHFDYLRWIRIVLRAAGARRVLHLGGAAASLARALLAEDPAGRHEVCEIDPATVAMAREHLGLRRQPGLRVRTVDGRRQLAATPRDRHDAVVIDAFVGRGMAQSLLDPGALRDAARAAPLTLLNIVDRRSASASAARAVADAMAGVYPAVFEFGRVGANRIVVGHRPEVGFDLTRLEGALAADPSPARLSYP